VITKTAQRFRTPSWPERLAAAVPSGERFDPLRRRLRPIVDWLIAPGGGGLRSVLPGGEVVLVSPAYRHITWNPDEYAALRDAVRPDDVVLDAGANAGAYAILFGHWVGPSGRVFAFEPDPVAVEGLKRHISLNAMTDRVTAVPAAVGDDRARRVRFALFDSTGISRLATDQEDVGTIVREVDALSIDRFCGERGLRPSVIKLDVEGSELAALRGARVTIAQAGRDLRLFVELHPQLWPRLGISAEDIQRECEAQGLEPEKLDGSRHDLWTTEGVCLRLRPSYRHV
jgi:FkbM family methyltransferase